MCIRDSITSRSTGRHNGQPISRRQLAVCCRTSRPRNISEHCAIVSHFSCKLTVYYLTGGQVAWSLPYYRPAASIFGPSGFNSAFGLDFGLRPQFSAVRDSFRSPASIHSTACSCSVTASYKDVDDASPWWPCLYDVTALLRLKRCGCKILEKSEIFWKVRLRQ